MERDEAALLYEQFLDSRFVREKKEILQKIKDTPFFVERSLDISEVNIRFDKTEIEKLGESEIAHKIKMRQAEMEKEQRQEAIELAKEESETFKEI